MTNRFSGVGIIGDGRLAFALGHLFGEHNQAVRLFAPDESLRAELLETRHIEAVLPEIKQINGAVILCQSADEVARHANLIFVPGSRIGTEALVMLLGEVLDGAHHVVHAIHELHGERLITTSELIRRRTALLQLGTLAGPMHVGELITGQPNAAVVGSSLLALANGAIDALHFPQMRVYQSSDLRGVELAAALVEIVSVAIGLADAIGLGAATHATLLTRGLAELVRVGERMGGGREPFQGLAGLGKLVDGAKRGGPNYEAGRLLVEGATPEALATAEAQGAGALSLIPRVRAYGTARDLDIPITSVLDDVINRCLTPREAVTFLMAVERRTE